MSEAADAPEPLNRQQYAAYMVSIFGLMGIAVESIARSGKRAEQGLLSVALGGMLAGLAGDKRLRIWWRQRRARRQRMVEIREPTPQPPSSAGSPMTRARFAIWLVGLLSLVVAQVAGIVGAKSHGQQILSILWLTAFLLVVALNKSFRTWPPK